MQQHQHSSALISNQHYSIIYTHQLILMLRLTTIARCSRPQQLEQSSATPRLYYVHTTIPPPPWMIQIHAQRQQQLGISGTNGNIVVARAHIDGRPKWQRHYICRMNDVRGWKRRDRSSSSFTAEIIATHHCRRLLRDQK